ncbi:MAG: hypothetical protein K5863_21585 [Nitratireductor sp.]|uniref:hypothetical protein n=1 Tax=Nitratireductor sp. TaxID=1872084 RepID=UPI0026225A01|nr:hypothetical protein [Nitratireductor sp.]MCV0352677.1 hypothetical protein [Nitratireductor sp.]
MLRRSKAMGAGAVKQADRCKWAFAPLTFRPLSATSSATRLKTGQFPHDRNIHGQQIYERLFFFALSAA